MTKKVSIITVGAAVQDVLMSGKVFKAHKEDGQLVEEFKLGEKYEVDEVTFSTGGGATNGAVTFARQGLRAKFIGKIGRDPAGDAVISDLRKDGVNVASVVHSKKLKTGYSSIIVSPKGERVVLVHRGASTDFRKKDFNLDKIEADWLFITSMAGSMDVIEMLVRDAKSKHMKVALIPGKGELKQAARLVKLIKGLDIVSANKEETQTLIKGSSIEELAVNLALYTGGIGVVTDGPDGVAASDGKKGYRAGMYEDVPVLDRLGAGDAFASGFTAAIAKGWPIEDAIVLASANSTSVVTMMGAKAGILHEDAELHDMDIHSWDV